jgi:hypothetical protein
MRRRLTAQIDGLNWAAGNIAHRAGDVVEIGLGNGRTYDHLRQEMPGRRIWVVDREMNAHPSCVPPEGDFLEGEATANLRRLIDAQTPVILAHYDLSKGVPEDDAALAAEVAPLIEELVLPGGLVVAGHALPGLRRIDGPGLIDPDRYYFYRI